MHDNLDYYSINELKSLLGLDRKSTRSLNYVMKKWGIPHDVLYKKHRYWKKSRLKYIQLAYKLEKGTPQYRRRILGKVNKQGLFQS